MGKLDRMNRILAPHFVDSANGADGISDREGKTARVAASEVGAEQVSILSKFLRPRSAFPNIRVIEVLRLFPHPYYPCNPWLSPPFFIGVHSSLKTRDSSLTPKNLKKFSLNPVEGIK